MYEQTISFPNLPGTTAILNLLHLTATYHAWYHFPFSVKFKSYEAQRELTDLLEAEGIGWHIGR